MSTQIDTRGPLERAYDAAVTAYETAERAYDEAPTGSAEETSDETAMAEAETACDAARTSYAASDEPRNYDLGDGGGGVETIYCSPSAIEAEWESWMVGGDWGDRTETAWAHGYYVDTLTEERTPCTYTIEADEPECAEGEAHDWCSPYSVLGGLKENPGVWGHGGGVISRDVCAHCGAYRIVDTWAQDPETGEQGLESVSYEAADERSCAWLWRRLAKRVEAVDIPDGYAVRCDTDARRMVLARETDEEALTLTDDDLREVVASCSWDATIAQMPEEEEEE